MDSNEIFKRVAIDVLRTDTKGLALNINGLVLEGREKSLAMTHLEEVLFWANAGIARAPKG